MADTVTQMKKKKKESPSPTKSFDQMVADAQLSRLKPYIQEQMGLMAEKIGQGVFQFIMHERAGMQTRQLAFERLLSKNAPWFSEDVLASAVAEVEDEADELLEVNGPVESGDKVRVEVSSKLQNSEKWTAPAKLAIQAVCVVGANGNLQTLESLENQLIGMTTGEEKEFQLGEPAQNGKEPEFSFCRVKMVRISRLVKKEGKE